MTTVTPTDAVQELAEMMGWTVHSRNTAYYVTSGTQDTIIFRETTKQLISDWNPLLPENLYQAKDCLEAWRKQDPHRSYNIASPFRGIDEFSVVLSTGVTACNSSENYAICEALLSAERGEQVRIAETATEEQD